MACANMMVYYERNTKNSGEVWGYVTHKKLGLIHKLADLE